MAIARMIVGKAMKSSVTRVIASSIHPPMNPATAPTSVPITVPNRMTVKPAGIVTRAPYSTRLNTSRPSSSVPMM
jgi:hypothetical protein